MPTVDYMKAVEFSKLPAKFRKEHGSVQALVDSGHWVQPKYDGCFMHVKVAEHRDTVEFRTRTGEFVRSCDHLKDGMLALARRLLEDGWPASAWDVLNFYGEAWHPARPFPEISGLFRRQYASPDLVFVVNDVTGTRREGPYSARWERLARAGIPVALPDGPQPPGSIWLAASYTFPAEPTGDIETYARWLSEWGGYDGAIVRDPDLPYTPGLVKNGEIIKVKPLLSLDLRVTAVHETPGEKTGRPVYTVSVVYNGVTTTVGSGMPHKARELPKIGDIVQIDSLGVTADGKLREPRYIDIRYDKMKAD